MKEVYAKTLRPAYLSIKENEIENEDSVRKGNSKQKNDTRGNQGPDNDLGGHD